MLFIVDLWSISQKLSHNTRAQKWLSTL